MKPFTIYPALDLRSGRVVRLQQGDPRRLTLYHEDPLAAAEQWVAAGARWLHIVNLDGAFGEAGQANRAAVAAICRALQGSSVRLQLGGGLRSLTDIEQAFDQGVNRVVLGTLALEKPTVLRQVVQRFGAAQVAGALDVQGKFVAVRGWQENSRIDALLAAHQMLQNGVQTLIYTDIHRDGMGSGLNLDFARQLLQMSGLELILSGGVQSLEDVRAARHLGACGVIIGKALYDGRIDLKAALQIEAELC
ncbi:MAG: 1-(5-phosphoribosyl)-5-[(5-phosphoribosylamino)methylideneamino]imidazole-4-carboxamide isomerase [Anaerolineae bacterium]|jgi:phosphoribosylformimino-5-aminoimidazole carboxamide ribotide isomerase|nr:MAG: 1-(5-phosphoribosyl)-5-[(5-phosphoribosylamino)methylideneamino]imidazole-4-carboxamide isomerase [Anaerolineae bacterium]